MGLNGDFYELCVKQTLFGEEVCNVFHYQLLRDGPGIGNLITEWNTNIKPVVQAVQSNDLTYVEYEGFNINSPQTEFSKAATAGTGTVTGDAMPRFVAFGFNLIRATKEVRNGSKRIAGVVESMVVDGVLDPLYQTSVDAVANAFASVIQVGGIDTFLPVILRRTGTLSTGYTVTASAAVNDANFVRITTQNSRKR